MQSLYSFLQNREGNLAQEVDFFKKSYLNTFSLYLALLTFLKSIYEHAIDQKDLQKDLRTNANPFYPGPLVENKILQFIAQHPILINYIKNNTDVPLLVSGRGNNFVYVHEDADFDMAAEIIKNGKS